MSIQSGSGLDTNQGECYIYKLLVHGFRFVVSCYAQRGDDVNFKNW